MANDYFKFFSQKRDLTVFGICYSFIIHCRKMKIFKHSVGKTPRSKYYKTILPIVLLFTIIWSIKAIARKIFRSYILTVLILLYTHVRKVYTHQKSSSRERAFCWYSKDHVDIRNYSLTYVPSMQLIQFSFIRKDS